MPHACFTPIALSFTTTLWHFYTISDTNLLTRCRSASSLFSAVFGFRKVTQEIFSELDETKAETPIFPGTFQSTEEALQPDQEVVSHPLGALRVWPRQGQVWAPSWPPTPSFRLYIAFLLKVTGRRSETPEKFRRRRHRQP